MVNIWKTRKKVWVFRFLCVFAATFFGLIAGEAGLRVYSYSKYGSPNAYNCDFFQPHPFLCYKAYPNFDGIVFGGIQVETNSLGFRSPELSLEKGKSTYRIAFLGGSTTFSSSVSGNENTFPYLVQKTVQKKFPNQTIEILSLIHI